MATRYHGTACKTCRRRGRKCTKELPFCQSCTSKGINCEGYALKWAGLASRGRLAGKNTLDDIVSRRKATSRKSPSTTASSSVSPPDIHQMDILDSSPSSSTDDSPHNTTNTLTATFSPSQFQNVADLEFELDFENTENPAEDVAHESVERDDMLPVARQMILHTNPLDPYNVPYELKFILNYHLLEVAPRLCVDNNSLKNPYTQYILPLAVQKPPLLYACAALAACHFSVRLTDRKFLIDCLRFRGKAMRRLQEALWSEQSAKDESNLGAVLMLTLTDMCLGGFSNFDAHFKAARRLIDLRGSDRTQDAFVEQYIAWLDIMSAASNHRQPLFTSTDVLALTGPERQWSHDVFPCPPDQFTYIAEVAEMYKSQPNPNHPTPEILAEVKTRKENLLTQPIHTERGSSWMHLTEAYRHAIVLYMIRLFRMEVDEDEIIWLTQSVFYHAKCTPPSTGWADQLLWPLFHAGLEIRDTRRQNWLRDRSQIMQLSGGFRNVETAMMILERVWKSETTPDYLTLLSENGVENMLVV